MGEGEGGAGLRATEQDGEGRWQVAGGSWQLADADGVVVCKSFEASGRKTA